MKLKKSILKYIFPKATVERRLALIRLELDLVPEDLITAVFVLTYDNDPVVSKEAREGFLAISENTVMKALSKDLAPEVISYIAENFPLSERVFDILALNSGTDDRTLVRLAGTCPLGALEIFVESARILRIPQVLSALKSNPNATSEVINRAEEQTKAMGVNGEVKASMPESLTDEHDEQDIEEILGLYQLVQSMSVGDKIKLALTGNKEARGILIKQSNKVVSRSVVRNPRITEDEIAQVTQTRSIADEILREIARNDEWLKNYAIRKGLVFNPKTPIQISLRLLAKLNNKDLAILAKSKGVPNVVTVSASKIVDRNKG
jgi:hypothetical protein